MKVTKDSVIGDVLKEHPNVAVIMIEQGLHCVGCSAKASETIESGCKVHGFSDEDISELVDKINSFIKRQESLPEKITLTDSAAKKLKGLLAEEKQGSGLRISVVPGGCSGLVYQMSIDDSPDGNTVFEVKGVKIFIDKQSLQIIKGSEVDYVESGKESGFRINNPD